jgi:hypothetical protein
MIEYDKNAFCFWLFALHGRGYEATVPTLFVIHQNISEL